MEPQLGSDICRVTLPYNGNGRREGFARFGTVDDRVSIDIELMLRLKSGEADVLDQLLKRHRNPVIHYLYRMVHDAAVAEELSQEVFLRVYRARDTYQPTTRFTTWLYRIATNRAINWIRDNRHQRNELPLEVCVTSKPAPAATPEQELLRRELYLRIRKAVCALPERQRAVVLLHKYNELEYLEIAEVLGCSLASVKALMNRAYFTLRRSLAAC